MTLYVRHRFRCSSVSQNVHLSFPIELSSSLATSHRFMINLFFENPLALCLTFLGLFEVAPLFRPEVGCAKL